MDPVVEALVDIMPIFLPVELIEHDLMWPIRALES